MHIFVLRISNANIGTHLLVLVGMEQRLVLHMLVGIHVHSLSVFIYFAWYVLVCMICTGLYCYALVYMLGQRFSAALLPQLFGTNPRSHHKGATGRV